MFLLLAVAFVSGREGRGWAQTPGVPADLQASLISKLVTYDRNLRARAGSAVRIVLLKKRGSIRSRVAAEAIKASLAPFERLAGLPAEVKVVEYDKAPALAQLCRAEHVAVVYVTPDFDGQLGELRAALSGVDVLSVSAVPEYVSEGVVLGFELVSGRPKIVLNLPQAKQQNVNFAPEVLRLMKVYR